jgi:gas vesicle protein
MTYRDENSSFAKTFVTFITGGIIGAAVALLYAPQSGERTREELREKAERTIIKAHKLEEEVKDSLNQLVSDVKSRVTLLIEEGKNVAEDKKKEILAAIEAGKKVLEEQKEKLQKNI